MILHAKQASITYNKVLISSPDTNVFVILLSLHPTIDADIFFLTGVKSTRRIIDVTKVADHIMSSLNPCMVDKEILIESLIGIHSFTGCDTISSFAGRGKIKPLNLMVRQQRYIEAFAELGKNIHITESLFEIIQSFVCHMYGSKGNDSNDEVRYRMYCRSGGKVSCEQLPPCYDVLQLHTKRANYQARIWRESLINNQSEVDPLEHGWMLDENQVIDIKWMTCNPAPEEVSIL
jgi:hypothetical protein